MPIDVVCTCGKKLRAKDELAGRQVRCPSCGKALLVGHVNPYQQASPLAPTSAPYRKGSKPKKKTKRKSAQQDELEFHHKLWAYPLGGILGILLVIGGIYLKRMIRQNVLVPRAPTVQETQEDELARLDRERRQRESEQRRARTRGSSQDALSGRSSNAGRAAESEVRFTLSDLKSRKMGIRFEVSVNWKLTGSVESSDTYFVVFELEDGSGQLIKKQISSAALIALKRGSIKASINERQMPALSCYVAKRGLSTRIGELEKVSEVLQLR